MNDLIERYIYAVTKRLPREKREDVAMELRGLVEDMLAERCPDTVPTEKDIRVVLTELGTPQELYAQYNEDADKCLIGQPYYATYKYVLKIVLASVVAGLTIAHMILAVMEPAGIPEAIAGWLNSMWNSLFGAFSFVTLLFAFFQRKGVVIHGSFDFNDLPPVPKSSREISKWESIAGIGFCVMFAVLFLLTPDVFSMYADGMRTPIFDPVTLRQTWFLIVAFSACGIIREAVGLLEGEYNRKVMVTALVADALSAALCIWWLQGYRLLNPAFVREISTLFAGESELICNIFARFDLFFLGCMLFALALDAVDTTVRTLRK